MDKTITWNTGLRANIRLWPEVAPHLAAFAQCDGLTYDQEALLASHFTPEDGRAPATTRAVRDAKLVTTLAGLAYVSAGQPPVVRLTELGHSVFSFLGLGTNRKWVNEENRNLLAADMMPGLAIVREYRAIWSIMRLTDNMLTGDELNRAMGRVQRLTDVPAAATAINEARSQNDPSIIGPQAYVTAAAEDQRKAMNPWFLLAGGGGLFVSVTGQDEYRRLDPSAVPKIDRLLRKRADLISVSSDREFALAISSQSGVRSPV